MKMKNVFLKFGLAAVIFTSSGLVAGNGLTFAEPHRKRSSEAISLIKELMELKDTYLDKREYVESGNKDKDEIETCRNKISKYETKVEDLKEEIGKLKKVLKRLKEGFKDDYGVKVDPDNIDQHIGEVSERLNNAEEKYAKLENKLKDLKESMVFWQDRFEEYSSEYNKINNKLTKNEKNLGLVDDMQSENEKLLELDCVDLQGQLNMSQSKNEELLKRNEKTKTVLSKLSKNSGAVEEKLRKQKESSNGENVKLESLKNENEKLMRKIEKLQKDYERSKSELSEENIINYNNQLSQEYSKNKSEIERLRGRVREINLEKSRKEFAKSSDFYGVYY